MRRWLNSLNLTVIGAIMQLWNMNAFWVTQKVLKHGSGGLKTKMFWLLNMDEK